MEKELLEQLKIIIQGMDCMERRLTQKIEDAETRTKIFIENEVSRKIEALFDGYKLTHEKQWELERETQRLKERVSDLEARIAAIEERFSA